MRLNFPEVLPDLVQLLTGGIDSRLGGAHNESIRTNGYPVEDDPVFDHLRTADRPRLSIDKFSEFRASKKTAVRGLDYTFIRPNLLAIIVTRNVKDRECLQDSFGGAHDNGIITSGSSEAPVPDHEFVNNLQSRVAPGAVHRHRRRPPIVAAHR